MSYCNLIIKSQFRSKRERSEFENYKVAFWNFVKKLKLVKSLCKPQLVKKYLNYSQNIMFNPKNFIIATKKIAKVHNYLYKSKYMKRTSKCVFLNSRG